MGRSTYIEVPAAAFRERILGAGFELSKRVSVGEEVYDRTHNTDPRYIVRVYSSIPRNGSTVRRVGEDAIRVCAVFYRDLRVNPNNCIGAGIFKAPRVYRTGTVEGVLDRVIERAREAYSFCNEHRKGLAAR